MGWCWSWVSIDRIWADTIAFEGWLSEFRPCLRFSHFGTLPYNTKNTAYRCTCWKGPGKYSWLCSSWAMELKLQPWLWYFHVFQLAITLWLKSLIASKQKLYWLSLLHVHRKSYQCLNHYESEKYFSPRPKTATPNQTQNSDHGNLTPHEQWGITDDGTSGWGWVKTEMSSIERTPLIRGNPYYKGRLHSGFK